MVTTLLVFSLLLHVVTFYIIIVLVQRMNHINSQPTHENFPDIDEALQAHLEAVREENQALIDYIDKSKIRYTEPVTTIVSEPIKQKAVEVKPAPILPPEPKPKPEPELEYAPPVVDIVDQVEQSSTAEVLHLHEQGLPSETIAKKLNIGKGEVELMLNLNRKKMTK